jgi:hypothetical protein
MNLKTKPRPVDRQRQLVDHQKSFRKGTSTYATFFSTSLALAFSSPLSAAFWNH